jgi:hypothetical protein
MKRLFTIPLTIVLSSAASSAQQAPPVPNLELEVAVRQKVDGKLEDGVHVLKLTCERGDCLLVSVTLNQCFLGMFYPKIETAGTRSGMLSVSMAGGVISVRQRGWAMGPYTSTFKFNVTRRIPSLTVTAFSGAYVKDSTSLGKVVAVEYVAVQNGGETLTLGCPVTLPGIVPPKPAKPSRPAANCTKDTDCGGDDVCIEHVCVKPR